jgi:hypothetical protein
MSKRTRVDIMYFRVLTAIVVVTMSSVSFADTEWSTKIATESINAYSCGPLSNRVVNANGFRNTMLSISGYTAGSNWWDGNVLTGDFIDPELQAGGADGLSGGFDETGTAIAFYSGHGSCPAGDFTLRCTSTASCADRPGHMKACLRWKTDPKPDFGFCAYSAPHYFITDPTGSSCEWVDYSTGPVSLGESNYSGTWRGAGSNGGVNLVVIDSSCSITATMYDWDLGAAFGGATTISAMMPTHGDTADVADRGSALANQYVANPSSSVAHGWTAALNSVTGGGSCLYGGGGHGINGCGAYVSVSVGVDSTHALWARDTENWTHIRHNINDPKAWANTAWVYTCNYDCNAHPFTFGN